MIAIIPMKQDQQKAIDEQKHGRRTGEVAYAGGEERHGSGEGEHGGGGEQDAKRHVNAGFHVTQEKVERKGSLLDH
jgi:hypothetical protein